MTPRIIVALVAVILSASILAASTSDAVLGRWSDGKNALTFRRDGTVIKRPMGTPGHAGTPMTLKYRSEENRVIITDSAGHQLLYQLRGGVLLGAAGEQFKPWDHVVVVFGFTMALDGSRRDIKFITCQDPMDLHEVKGALTEKEKRAGIQLMAQRRHPIPQQEVGKTRYDYALFDNRTKSYIQ